MTEQTFEEKFPNLKNENLIKANFGEYKRFIFNWFKEHTKSVSINGEMVLKNVFSLDDEFEYIDEPRKLGLTYIEVFDKESIQKGCTDNKIILDAINKICNEHSGEGGYLTTGEEIQNDLFEELKL